MITIEIAVIPLHSEPRWTAALTCRSVREAHASLPDAAYQVVDRLSSASYDMRLRLADGTVKPVSLAKQDYAERWARGEQHRNSIGYRISRGETPCC